jgi:transcriptional regulator with XRE-family HTH domain
VQVPYPAKTLLVARWLKQVDVAREVGVGATTLNRVLNRRLAPWPALKQRLSEHLQVPEAELFDEGSL